MSGHPGLAKGKLSNCPQARATSNKLWDQLTIKLNAAGPPTKNVTMWRKVYINILCIITHTLCTNQLQRLGVCRPKASGKKEALVQ